MRHVQVIRPLLLLVCVAGVRAAPPGAPATPVPATSSSPAATPEKTYVHPGTKFPFPERLAGFTRTEITKYSPDESDISAGYNCDDPANHIAVTVYVFPAPPLSRADAPADAKTRQFEKALDAIKREIAGVHPDAKAIAEGPYTLKEGGRSHQGTKVTYEMTYIIGTSKELTASDALLFVEGPWQFEYRISYPKARAQQAQPLIEKLLASLTWSEK